MVAQGASVLDRSTGEMTFTFESLTDDPIATRVAASRSGDLDNCPPLASHFETASRSKASARWAFNFRPHHGGAMRFAQGRVRRSPPVPRFDQRSR